MNTETGERRGAGTTLRVEPGPPPRGELRVPGDKSLSHRLAILCALAPGRSVLHGFLRCGDCLCTLRALDALGAGHRWLECGAAEIRGGPLGRPAGPLDLGNSGTGMRLLAGLLAGYPMEVELVGDASLQSRPMERVAEPLRRMGARVDLAGGAGTAPIRIRGGGLKGIRYHLPAASAQVQSALLLAALHAEGATTVVEPLPIRDHTERLLAALGLPVRREGRAVTVQGFGARGPDIPAGEWTLPGDFSSAAFWIASAAARPGARTTLRGIGLNPRRTGLLEALRRMGAAIEPLGVPGSGRGGEPVGDLRIRGGTLRGTTLGGALIPDLIDELPAVAAAAALAEGETLVRDAGELRHKESDRIAALTENLVRLGIEAEARPDGFRIRGPARWRKPATLDSRGDHRIAMALAVLAGAGHGTVRIRNAGCTETSYPGFWDDYRRLGGRAEAEP